MRFRKTAIAALLAGSVLPAPPALALPDNASELHASIVGEYGNDANAWVEDNGGDFRVMACRKRADLLRQLLDDGLEVSRISTKRLQPFYTCALDKNDEQIFPMIVEPKSLARIERESARWGLPLHYSIGKDSHANTLAILKNGGHIWDKRDLAMRNYTRDGQLLNAAAVAIDQDNQNALRAFYDAGMGEIVEDARDKGFRHVVGQLALERDGKGGGLFGGILDLAVGAALGGSPMDFLIASAGTSALGSSGGGSTSVSASDRNAMKVRMARYLSNVETPVTASAVSEATAPASPTAEATGLSRLDTVEELERLAILRDRGVISEEEFDALKAKAIADR